MEERSGAGGSKGAPQPPQNLAAALQLKPHRPHSNVNAPPQLSQNRLESVFAV
jgi:hypothetical protein